MASAGLSTTTALVAAGAAVLGVAVGYTIAAGRASAAVKPLKGAADVLLHNGAAVADKGKPVKQKQAIPVYRTALLTLMLPVDESTRRANVAMIAACVAQVSEKVFIAFDGYGSGKEDVRLSPDVTRGLLRHYDDFFEACVAQGKHGLSCIILMPQGTGSGSSRELPWADENSVYSREDFEAIMSQDSDELRGIVQDVNLYRGSTPKLRDLPPVEFVSLTPVVESLSKGNVMHFDDIRGRFPRFRRVIVAGTFDHLHAGHSKLLTVAVLLTREHLTIGITGDSMLTRKKYASQLDNFEVRRLAVEAFIRLIHPTLKYSIAKIEDIYGPTATDKSLNALVCSSESALNAALVNRLRQQNNMSTLQLVAVQRTSAVSSTLERAQEAHLDLCHKLDSLKL